MCNKIQPTKLSIISITERLIVAGLIEQVDND